MAQAAWIWWLGGGVLALAGLVLLWWSLFRDRARGRRRCPRCWYDMGGVPGLVCPECGRSARREKRLLRTRRHRWRAALALLVFAAGCGGVAYPSLSTRIVRDGPLSMIPTTVLLRFAPDAGLASTWDPVARDSKWHPVFWELFRRRAQDTMTAQQWDWYMQNKRVIEWPDRWPAGTPLQVIMRAPEWTVDCKIQAHLSLDDGVSASVGATRPWGLCSDPWIPNAPDGFRRIPVTLDQSERVTLDIEILCGSTIGDFGYAAHPDDPNRLWKGQVSHAITIVPTALDVFQIVEGVAWDECMRTALAPEVQVHVWGSSFSEVVAFLTLDRSSGSSLEDIAIGFEVQLFRDGEVVASAPVTRLETILDDNLDDVYLFGHAVWETRGEKLGPLLAEDLTPWTLRVIGRPELAILDFRQDRAWRGSFEIPLDGLTTIKDDR